MPRTISRGRPRDDEEQEERPARTRRSSRDDEEQEERPARTRRSSRDDDEGSSRRSENAPRPSNMGAGRASVRKHRETHRSGDFAPKFTVDKEPVLLRFVEDDFILTYYEHWIREFQGQRRQMSFVCLGENDCPLCDIGDTPKFTALINVIDLSNPRDPQVKVWYATPNPAGEIDDRMDDDKYSPVNRDDLYWVVTKKRQANKSYAFSLTPVKLRDLEEDWDTEPLTGDEIADLAKQAYGEDACVRITPRRDMQAIADELSG